MRRARWLAVLLVAVLAGCATVPSGSRVLSGRNVERARSFDDPYVRLIAVPPDRDLSQWQIVYGFLNASGSFDDNHAVARSYLAPGVQWRPGGQTIVYESVGAQQDRPETGDEATIVARAKQLGVIGGNGQYTASRQTTDETFRLRKNAQGQWRISALPAELANGLLLSQQDVQRAYRPLNLYFFAQDGPPLVPNPVFVPLENRRNLATQLVRSLLGGPTSWLLPAVVTKFPTGTRLVGDSVDVSEGVATVNLSKQARQGDQRGMSAQLMWTLRQLPEIKQLRVQIEGRELVVPGSSGAVQSPGDWVGNNPDGIGLRQPTPYLRGPGDRLFALYNEKPVQVAERLQVHRPAISLDRNRVAGLSSSGRSVLVGDLAGGSPLRSVLDSTVKGAVFTAPSWDRRGNVWTVESSRTGSRLWILLGGRQPMQVADWELAGRQVTALRVARDGARAAVIVQDHTHSSEIEIGQVSQHGGSLVAADFLPVSSGLVETTDLAWRNATELAVLGRTESAAQLLPYRVPISGGQVSPLGTGASGDMSFITAAPESPFLMGARVTGQDSAGDKVCRLNEEYGQWSCTVPGTEPAYPG